MAETNEWRKKKTKVGVLFLGRQRPGFDPEWGREMRSRIRLFLEQQSVDATIPSDNIAEEASLRQSLDACRAAGVGALVVAQPTISDGRLSPVLGQIWGGPVVLWATPEKPTGEMISSNSLVGTHVFAATLRQLGKPFELLIGAPDDRVFPRAFEEATRLVAAASALHAAKVGLIGYHAPGFIDLQADAAELSRRLGTELFHMSVGEFLSQVEAEESRRVEQDVAATEALGLPLRGAPAEVLMLQSRFYLAIKAIMADHGLAALALRCWPDLPDQVGAWPYLAVSRLATEGLAVVPEGDVDGALSILIAQELGHGPVYVSDWLEHDRSHVTIWHTGSPPLQLCEPIGEARGPAITVHFNNKKPAVVEATIRAGIEATAFRLWRCDGAYHLAAFEGTTRSPARHLLGVNGVLESSGTDIVEWFDETVHEGMPHHVCVAPGRFAGHLERFARLTGIRWHGSGYRREPEP